MMTAAVWLAWVSLGSVLFYAVPIEQQSREMNIAQGGIVLLAFVTSTAAALLATLAINGVTP